ncbi:potassium transporter 5-like [Cucurbita moschata]|uniref:Potassium transporter n=1 Tax=Cucurbita moschata TaxID=3662 RepID=A0A6J1H6N3_CUCMO|nr:potassium transporter 5-like [Cucurbita moschata]
MEVDRTADNHPDLQESSDDSTPNLAERKLRRNDSLDVESRTIPGAGAGSHGHKVASWVVILQLAFQSIGVVYGDIGTSPLYVYASTFTEGIKHSDDVLGVLSLILYTLTLIPLLKYVFFVLQANDNGEGGTFALYSLLCRYAKIGLIPSQQVEDQEVSNFQVAPPTNRQKMASCLKSKLENSRAAKIFLLFATMLGTSMVIGDGVLTPSISVLSAVGGIKNATSTMTQDKIVWISAAILVCLFMVQRFGTHKVGYSFAPIICIWFILIGGIGFYNFIKFDPSVIKAVNPKYIFQYFKRNKMDAWISLGGVVLAITGTEALFADVGHFTVMSIRLSMCCVTYPALVSAYVGQASFLRKHADLVSDTFFESIPGPLYWPTFVVAVLASIVASQAMISGTFSIIQQSLSYGCFPRVKVVHTSSKYEGQVYIPEVNYLLMFACLGVTLGFKDTTRIGNAYGIAVVFVMALTSSFLVLIMIMIWKSHVLIIISYVLTIGLLEFLYLSSVLYKFDQGGYLPLAFAGVLMIIMYIWHDVHRRKYYYELEHKISAEKVKDIASLTTINRVPGLALFYSELVQGIPPIFNHYLVNIPTLQRVLIFVSFKSLPISKVPMEERFLFRRVEPRDINVFRCVVRYGYRDIIHEQESFERVLVERLKGFIEEELWTLENDDGRVEEKRRKVEEEIEVVDRAWRDGIVHLIGQNEVVASKGSGFAKRVLIDYAYNALRRNLRQSEEVFYIPRKRMLKVGMTYEL